MNSQKSDYKIQKAGAKSTSALRKYQDLVLGSRSIWFLLKFELITFLFAYWPGALGILLRKWTYPCILGQVGQGVLFGHHVSFRHPQKIKIDDGTVVDDYVMLDAKGANNQGIQIGKNVFIGRDSILYCKDGNIILEDQVNLGHRCIIFSAHHVSIGQGTFLAADCYVMSGGAYDYRSSLKFVEQDGAITKGPLHIGTDCWLGAKTVVLDGITIGNGCVVGAGAVVTNSLLDRMVAVGVPAKVVKSRDI